MSWQSVLYFHAGAASDAADLAHANAKLAALGGKKGAAGKAGVAGKVAWNSANSNALAVGSAATLLAGALFF